MVTLSYGVLAITDENMKNFTIKDLKCDNAKQIYELRNMLYERSNEPSFRYHLRNNGTLCFVCCTIMIIGVFGNTLNFASILHSKIKKLNGFDENFRRISIFILNLSFIELFILVFGMLPNILSLLLPGWYFIARLCQVYPLVWRNSYILESSAIAIISMGRCMDILKPDIWRTYSNNTTRLAFFVASPWFLWGISLIPVLMKSSEIEMGWNCAVGYCTQIIKCPLSDCPDYVPNWTFIIWYSFLVTSASVITTIICYVLIYLRARVSSKTLKQIGNVKNEMLRIREMKLTRTILVLVLSHTLCNVPTLLIDTVIYSTFGSSITWNVAMKYLCGAFYILYNIQFIINVFIYAATNKDFQMAYLDFLKWLTCQKIRK